MKINACCLLLAMIFTEGHPRLRSGLDWKHPLQPNCARLDPAIDLEQDEILEWTRTLLESSGDLAVLKDRTSGFTDLSRIELQGFLGRVARADYPSSDPTGLAARNALLAEGRAAFPVLINAIKSLDLESYEGVCQANFASRLLQEIVYGGFGSQFDLNPIAIEDNAKLIECWDLLWSRIENDDEFWATLHDLQDMARKPISDLSCKLDFTMTELVMSRGMRIKAVTPTGTISIDADQGFGRSYTWDLGTRFVVMDPRAKRWFGSLGLYYPGPGDHWEDHNGITRGVLEEGQRHFSSTDEAIAWLRYNNQSNLWTDDGLVVSFSKLGQLSVDIWQIYINGKKPSVLPGSQNGKIVVSQCLQTGALVPTQED